LFYFPWHGFQNQGVEYSANDVNRVKTVLFDTQDGENEVNNIFEEYFHLLISRLNFEREMIFLQLLTFLKY